VKEYRSSTNELILRRVFDRNQILLDNPHDSTSEDETSFMKKYKILSQQEEEALVSKIQNTTDHLY
jgi:hypothetical protein